MALSPEELVKTKARLGEAEAALHALMTGRSVVRVQDQNGESVTYGAANVSRLKAYIADLKDLISTGGRDLSPIRPVFGR